MQKHQTLFSIIYSRMHRALYTKIDFIVILCYHNPIISQNRRAAFRAAVDRSSVV